VLQQCYSGSFAAVPTVRGGCDPRLGLVVEATVPNGYISAWRSRHKVAQQPIGIFALLNRCPLGDFGPLDAISAAPGLSLQTEPLSKATTSERWVAGAKPNRSPRTPPANRQHFVKTAGASHNALSSSSSVGGGSPASCGRGRELRVGVTVALGLLPRGTATGE
jgi:hypothetical protein